MEDSPSANEHPLRLLMTTDAVGGVWHYSLDLARELSKEGVSILLVVLGPRPSESQRETASRIRGLQIIEGDFALEWMDSPWADVDASGRWLIELQREFRADVIHLNGYSHAALAWNAPVITVAHSCVYSWWNAVHRSDPGLEWQEYHDRVTLGLSASTMIVSVSDDLADHLVSHYSIERSKIVVISNFARVSIRPDVAKQPFILASGRLWDEAKNLELLRSVSSRLIWPLRIAGENCHPDAGTIPQATTHSLGPLPREELNFVMAAAGIFAHPALYEPFGLSVLEAAHNSCCLVLADIPSLRDLWDGAAIFVDPRNPGKWVRQLNDLCTDAERRTEFGSRARVHAARYSAVNTVQSYLNLYRELNTAQTPNQGRAA